MNVTCGEAVLVANNLVKKIGVFFSNHLIFTAKNAIFTQNGEQTKACAARRIDL